MIVLCVVYNMYYLALYYYLNLLHAVEDRTIHNMIQCILIYSSCTFCVYNITIVYSSHSHYCLLQFVKKNAYRYLANIYVLSSTTSSYDSTIIRIVSP